MELKSKLAGMAVIVTIMCTVSAQAFASDTRITVTGYTTQADEYIIHATAGATLIDLLCDVDSPYCSPPAPGEYWMADWTVPMSEYRGDYVCRDVDLFQPAAKGDKGRKIGEFCLVQK